jgi:ABC-type multidrug transport system fused ATPase/permease subunit
VQRAAASLQRVGALLATRPAVRGGAGVVWPAGAPKLSYEAVDFAYGAGPQVLNGISFELEPGQVLGLLGRTGGGKTSLIRLLCRLHDPSGGAIRLDGRDIREAGLDQLRRRIGVVGQDVQVFTASVRDNVSLFDGSVADARIVEVLGDIGLGPWLARQPRGLDTIVAGAAGLSAGEGQLLAFARIFLKDPRLVVLDEASSRLDPAADRLVERAMDRLLKSRSAIIIAHRLETIRRADRVLILEASRVVEQGDRAALAADPASRLARLMAAAGDGALA